MSKKKNKKKNGSLGLDSTIDLGGGEFMTYTPKVVEKPNIYVGNKNKSDFPSLINILKKSQFELKFYLRTNLEYYYKKEDIICGDGYIYVRGVDPICLTSHIDTTPTVGGVKRIAIIDFFENIQTDENGNTTHTLTSPQGIGGDDRCGVWSIMNILAETKFRPYIVFCEDEEIGCVGSSKFAKTEYANELSNCKFLVEIDRKGNNDAVFYDDDNQEFHKWVEDVTGYKEASGTCSDICNLSSACGVSSVNLSSGYYHEHTLEEKIIVEETMHTKDVVIKLLEEGCKDDVKQFEYVERKYSWYEKWNSNYYGDYYRNLSKRYSWYDDDDDDDNWSGYNYGGYEHSKYSKSDADRYNETNISCDIELGFKGFFVYVNENGEEDEVCVEADSKLGCIAKFLMENINICWADVLDYYFEEMV